MKVRSLIDSGASVSLLHNKIYNSIKGLPKLEKKKVNLQGVNGASLNVLGSINLDFNMKGNKMNHTFYVVSDMNRNAILGRDWLVKFGVRVYFSLGCLRINKTYVPLVEDIHIASIVRLAQTTVFKPQTSNICYVKGFKINIDGVKPDDAKVEAIKTLPNPVTVKEIEWLAGTDNTSADYLSRRPPGQEGNQNQSETIEVDISDKAFQINTLNSNEFNPKDFASCDYKEDDQLSVKECTIPGYDMKIEQSLDIELSEIINKKKHRKSKLDTKWKPYYRIIEKLLPLPLSLKNQLDGSVAKKVHLEHLKKAKIDEWVIPTNLEGWSLRRWMVDHMQVGFLTMDGGSHAGWSFRRWMVDHMQVGFSTMDGGSHAGWSFRRWMVDHMQVGVFNDGWWITCRSE
ncbi:unnamed protein product [Mytilus edulis]|uniref:Peptidase A2 domain-containing protein n=1 Tax=Mytilus edulis TaxID=6550 RepID=A0A8S3S0D3_MYTED|nr:unnamed protein product [Mytilus edulis]